MHGGIVTAFRILGSAGRFVPTRGPLTDRHLPGLLFGVLAILSSAQALDSAGRGLPNPGSSIGLVHLLDVAHHVLMSLFCGLIAVLFLLRTVPRGERARPPSLAVAMVGTFVMGAVAARPATMHDWRILAVSEALLVGGLAFSIYGAASLRESFGLAPEARALVTSGAYRLVRHPIYLGELVAATGALLPVLAPATILVFAVFCACLFARVVLEERVLRAACSQYEEYRGRTPALVPWPRPTVRPPAAAGYPSDVRRDRPWRRMTSQGKTKTVHWPPEIA